MGVGGIRIGGGRPPEGNIYFRNGVPVKTKVVRGFTPREQRIAENYLKSQEDAFRTGITNSYANDAYERMMRQRDPDYGFLPLPGGKGMFSKKEAKRNPDAFKAAQNAAMIKMDIERFGYDTFAFNELLDALDFDGLDASDKQKIKEFIQRSILGGTMRADVGKRLASQYGIV
tara:strand:+ start:1939 stop:2457 length:519 start_codon:yes stop_codon:yes gene_type:complete